MNDKDLNALHCNLANHFIDCANERCNQIGSSDFVASAMVAAAAAFSYFNLMKMTGRKEFTKDEINRITKQFRYQLIEFQRQQVKQ